MGLKMRFSIYTTLYLIKQNNFPFLHHLINFSKFAQEGEVIVATNKEGIVDGTLSILNEFIEENKLLNVGIVLSNESFSSNRFDGSLKDFALQSTRYDIKIQIDFDEKFVLSQRERWIKYSEELLNSDYQALFVPSIDLYKGEKYIRKNHNLGQKWRIHKAGLKRGVWREAELDNGLFSTSKSDSGELLDQTNNLVSTWQIAPFRCLKPENVRELNNYIYTLHYGHCNLEYRQKINQNWWKDKWFDRMNKEEKVEINLQVLEQEEVIEHELILE